VSAASFRHAWDGIYHAFTKHPNLRIHVAVAFLATILGVLLGLTSLEFVILLFTIFLVIMAEMINTALESMTNLITLEYRQEAKIAKDVAAGMVLIAAILSIVVGLAIFLPHLLNLTYTS